MGGGTTVAWWCRVSWLAGHRGTPGQNGPEQQRGSYGGSLKAQPEPQWSRL